MEECINEDLERYGLRREDHAMERNGKSKLEQILLTLASQDNGMKWTLLLFVVDFGSCSRETTSLS